VFRRCGGAVAHRAPGCLAAARCAANIHPLVALRHE
jgi:hypothetical protein